MSAGSNPAGVDLAFFCFFFPCVERGSHEDVGFGGVAEEGLIWWRVPTYTIFDAARDSCRAVLSIKLHQVLSLH